MKVWKSTVKLAFEVSCLNPSWGAIGKASSFQTRKQRDLLGLSRLCSIISIRQCRGEKRKGCEAALCCAVRYKFGDFCRLICSGAICWKSCGSRSFGGPCRSFPMQNIPRTIFLSLWLSCWRWENVANSIMSHDEKGLKVATFLVWPRMVMKNIGNAPGRKGLGEPGPAAFRTTIRTKTRKLERLA